MRVSTRARASPDRTLLFPCRVAPVRWLKRADPVTALAPARWRQSTTWAGVLDEINGAPLTSLLPVRRMTQPSTGAPKHGERRAAGELEQRLPSNYDQRRLQSGADTAENDVTGLDSEAGHETAQGCKRIVHCTHDAEGRVSRDHDERADLKMPMCTSLPTVFPSTAATPSF